MVEKKIIARISNGFGNQLFIYAASYAFSKSLNYNLYLDVKSGMKKLKKFNNHDKKFSHYIPKFELSIFKLSATVAPDYLCFNSKMGYLKRKIFSFIDPFIEQKKFIIEYKDIKKITRFDNSFLKNTFNKILYVEGYFESEKYFSNYQRDLCKEFTFKNPVTCNENYLDLINNSNSVSIALRRNRYSEPFSDNKSLAKIKKSNDFDLEQSKYVLNAIEYFNKKINNPIFFVFSDDFTDIYKLIPKNKNIFLVNEFKNNKIVEDFYLMGKCKHFIVGPTTFHWWAAWLSRNNNKICLRPKLPFLNPSGNSDFWPSSWIAI